MKFPFPKYIILLWFFSPIATNAQTNISSGALVCNTNEYSSFPLVCSDHVSTICYDRNEYQGVKRAISDLQHDIKRVTGKSLLSTIEQDLPKYPVIIGTLGKNQIINKLAENKKLKISDIKNKWESFIITTVDKPQPNIPRALIIAGSDKRGTIYGIYELSKQLGVSPWYWWADVPIQKHKEAYVRNIYYASGEPKVKYRGIFINDEFPSMTGWAKEKFGGMNSKMYAHVFELLLRLRANCLWPAMWGSFKEYKPLVPILKDNNGNYEGNCFNEDDPENPKLADEYGIIIGTSHHEPMQRSQQEWIRHKQNYGNGEWNYLKNKKALQKFFKEGIEHTKNYESLITIGMRGDEDRPMVDAGSAKANFITLKRIIDDQRKIIKQATGKPLSDTPQVWTLYSEVLDYYNQGMKIPDDVIIMYCDDNFGDVRRLPDLNRPQHPGGYGMYYHVGYYGAPRACKWLNMYQIEHLWEQLQLTYSYGVNKLWILNVGDLKPHEFPIDFFMKMAWNPQSFHADNLMNYTKDFCASLFGEDQAEDAAFLLDTYAQYCSRITAEMLNEKTYNLENGEFKSVRDEFMALEAQAYRQYFTLKKEYINSYKELILFPIQAMANLYDMYYSLAMNKKYAREKSLTANEWAKKVNKCYLRDSLLCYDYNHNIAHGKWNHMMDQVHIGYTNWHAPQFNIRPQTSWIDSLQTVNNGYCFTEKNKVIVIEAEHYYKSNANNKTTWTVIPHLGRTLSGIALMPYTEKTQNASLCYSIKLESKLDSVKVRLVLGSTMPFIKGGHKIKIGFNISNTKTLNINNELNWKNNYTKMYPTAAARIIEKQVSLALPSSKNGTYIFTFQPQDPGIVLYKNTIDCGGYEDSWLKMKESPYKKENY